MNRITRSRGRGLALSALLAAGTIAGAAHAAPVSGKHTDSQGRMQLIIGQTTDGIYDYTVNSNLPTPWGVTMYAPPSLASAGFTTANGTLSTNADWYKYGYGPQDLSFIKNTSKLAGAAIAVGYWIGADYDYDIANGTNASGENAGNILWENTRRMITDLKNTGRPILLRIGYEAEAPWNGHWPANYKTVWSKIKAEINAQGANNIATVWQLAAYCPDTDFWGAGITPRTLVASRPLAATGANSNGVQNVPESNPGSVYDQWYPGNDADWTGISIFDPEDCANGYGALQSVVNYLKTKGKPILVAESAARGYDYDPSSGLYIYNQQGKPKRGNLSPTTVWNEWYAPYFQFLRANSDWIRAVAYISDDWQKYSHWQCTVDTNGNKISGCAEANWGNTRVDVNATIKTNWLAQLTSDGKFITTSGTGGGGTTPTGATLPSGNYQLLNKNSNKCVDVSGGNTANNANIVQWDCIAGAQNQQWQFVATDSGFYRLTARHSGKVIDIAGGNTANGAKAIQWEYLGGANQQWKPFDVGGGYYKFISRSSGRALELPGCNTANGTQLQQWDDLNNACQAFRIAQVTDTGGGTGGSVNLPGTVTSTSFTGSKSFTVNVTAAGNYYFRINYSATASSKLITTTFNGTSSNAAVNSGTGTVQSTDFSSVAAGSKTLTINAESGVTVTSVEALKR